MWKWSFDIGSVACGIPAAIPRHVTVTQKRVGGDVIVRGVEDGRGACFTPTELDLFQRRSWRLRQSMKVVTVNSQGIMEQGRAEAEILD